MFLEFLKKVLAHHPADKIVMILDNGWIHHARLIQPFLDTHRNRLELVFLPLYSSQLNLV